MALNTYMQQAFGSGRGGGGGEGVTEIREGAGDDGMAKEKIRPPAFSLFLWLTAHHSFS